MCPGSGTIAGLCDLVDVVGPLTLDEFKNSEALHQVKPFRQGQPSRYRRPHAWVLKGARRLSRPVAYRHPQGAVIWVNLSDEEVERVTAERAAEERALELASKKKSGKKTKPKKSVHEGQAGLFAPPVAAEPVDEAPIVLSPGPSSAAVVEEAAFEEEVDEEDASPRAVVRTWFQDQPGWHARADVLAEVRLTEVEWNQAIGELVASGEVKRTGEKRGTRYRWWGDGERSLS